MFRKHGHYVGNKPSKTWQAWNGMKQRCTNPNDKGFKNYGGRGIKVCERWLESFENFLADMGEIPPGLSIDRIDVDGDYCKENCRFANDKEQMRNRRCNRLVTIEGETKTIGEWAELSGLAFSTINNRILRGWAHDDLLKPSRSTMCRFVTMEGETHCVKDWAKIKGVPYRTVYNRHAKGLPIEDCFYTAA